MVQVSAQLLLSEVFHSPEFPVLKAICARRGFSNLALLGLSKRQEGPVE